MDRETRMERETLLVASILFFGSLLILYPFLDSLVLAAVVAYLLAFAHDKLNPHIENERLSTLILTTSVFGALSLGLYFFVNNFFDILAQFNLFAGSLQENIIQALEPLDLPESFIENIEGYIDSFSSATENYLIDLFVSLPSLMIDIGIFFVTTIYLYKDRERLEKIIKNIIDSLPPTESRIVKSLRKSVDEIFKGVFLTQFVVAILLGGLTAVGFSLIGIITSPIQLLPIWVILVIVASLLPLLANLMIYAPLGVYYMVPGAEPLKGVLILIYGVLVLQVLPEMLLRPYIGSRSLGEHPLIIFLGFLAGPLVLGVKGLVLGPLILILTKEFAFNYADLVSEPDPESHSADTEN